MNESTVPSSATSFAKVLAAEIVAVQRFVALLKEEKAALSDARLSGLERVVQEKGELAETLEKIGRQRQDCLQAAGVTAAGAAAIDAWLAAQPDERLRQGWRRLQELAREAKAQNELNGQCIALLSRNNRQVLDVLTGRKPQDALYGPNGQAAGSGGGHLVDAV